MTNAILGMVGIVGGFYFYTYAYRAGDDLPVDAGAAYISLGCVAMVCGGVLLGLGLFPPQ